MSSVGTPPDDITPPDDSETDLDSDGEIEPETDKKKIFIDWVHDLTCNRLDPITLFKHPFHQIFTPYPFQRHDEVTYLRTLQFQNTLRAAFPEKVQEIYLFHYHISRKEPKRHMLEIFIKILGGYLYFENRQGGCECFRPPPDHKNVTRLYFGMDKTCIENLARISMRRECWTWRPVEHRYQECYKELAQMNVEESKDTPDNGMLENTSEDGKLKASSFESYASIDFDDNERWNPFAFERRRKKKVQEMFHTYWTNRDAQDTNGTTLQNATENI